MRERAESQFRRREVPLDYVRDRLGILGFCWHLLVGGPSRVYAVERYVERLYPEFWKKNVDPWLTPSRRKHSLIGFAVAAYLIGNFRAWNAEREARIAAEQQVASNEQRLAIKGMLGKFIADGEKLFTECQQSNQKQCETDVVAWGTKADDFILAAFGVGEQSLFESLAGYTFYSGTIARNKLDGSIRRLNDLLQRSNSVPIEKDFDIGLFRS